MTEYGKRLKVFWDDAPRRRLIGVILAVYFALAGLNRPGFWGKYTESRRSEISREMYEETGDLLVPTLIGERILTKPPGFYWLQTVSYRVFGRVDEWTARLPGVLLALGALAAFFYLGRRLFDGDTAWLSSGILLTSYLFLRQVRCAEIDIVFAALLMFEMVLLLLGVEAEKRRQRLLFFSGFWVLAGAAFMVKGPLSVLFPVIGVSAAWFRLRRSGEAFRLSPIFLNPGPLLFLLLALPWYGVLVQRVPDAISVFQRETMGRFGAHTRHVEAFYYYLLKVTVMAPWLFFIPASVKWAWNARRRQSTVLLAIALGGVLFLSLLRSKKEIYLLPLLPAWAMLIAAWLRRTGGAGTDDSPWIRRTLGVLAVLTALAGCAVFGFLAWWNPQFLSLGCTAFFLLVGLWALVRPICAVRKFYGDLPALTERLVLGILCVAILAIHWGQPALDGGHCVKIFARRVAQQVPKMEKLYAYDIENYALSFYARRIIPKLPPQELSTFSGWLIAPADTLPKLRQAGSLKIMLKNRDLVRALRFKSSYDLLLLRFSGTAVPDQP